MVLLCKFMYLSLQFETLSKEKGEEISIYLYRYISFYCILFQCISRYCTFYKLKVCVNKELPDSSLFEQLHVLKFQFSLSVVTAFCHHVDFSTPGLPVHHQLPELAQTHVHRVGDANQPLHPLLSPSPPIFNLSQHQGLLK